MAGVFGANLMSYLRLLTPGELDKLIKTSEKRDKVKLTELVLSDCITDFSNTRTTTDSFGTSKPGLKKLEITEEEESEEDKNPYKTKTQKEETKAEELVEEKPRERPPTREEFRFDHNLEEKQSLSSFMLDQKKKMSISQKKLKQKEVLTLYKSTGKVEVSNRVSDEDEETSKEANLNFYSGLLIDKKTG